MSSANARFSTYSGAPSLGPSLAPTFDSQPSARDSQATTTYLSPHGASEKSGQLYGSNNPAAVSTSTLNSSDPKSADIKSWAGALDRMQDERLDRQRFVMNTNKSEEVAATALGAKVERALSRRMVGQDATMPPKKRIDSEKRKLEVEAR